LAHFPWVRFADLPLFFCRGFLVVLLRGLFFWDGVGLWGAGQASVGTVVRVELDSMVFPAYYRVVELEPRES